VPFLIGNSLSLLGPATDALHLHSTTTNREKARRGEPAGQCGCPEERYRTGHENAGGQTSGLVIIAIGRTCMVSLRHPQPLPRLWALPVRRLWAVVRYSGRGRTTVRRKVSLPAPSPFGPRWGP
jgi:hypothetical protein